jgi:CheY-like chemotaxis protein
LKIILEYSAKIDASTICEKAYNGQQAIDIIREDIEKKHMGQRSSFSFILMDCNMPVLDGYESCKQIREVYFAFGIS